MEGREKVQVTRSERAPSAVVEVVAEERRRVGQVMSGNEGLRAG